jgi:hypothetical protein
MSFTASGTGRIRVIGFDNYDGENNFIVAWKKNTYKDDGTVDSIETKLTYRITTTDAEGNSETKETTTTLPEDTYNFSCAITYPYMVYTYSDGSRTIGTIENRTLVVINVKTGATGTFENEQLLMTTNDQPDLTYEGYERYRTLVACGIKEGDIDGLER